MGWIYFFCIAYALPLLLVPHHKYKKYFPIGLVSIIILFIIDSTFIKLGAFSYSFGTPYISKLPLLYLLSAIPGGILLVHFFPQKNRRMQLPYILLAAALFLIIELVMLWLKYFNYHDWSFLNSYILDIFGFIIVIWLSQYFNIYST